MLFEVEIEARHNVFGHLCKFYQVIDIPATTIEDANKWCIQNRGWMRVTGIVNTIIKKERESLILNNLKFENILN